MLTSMTVDGSGYLWVGSQDWALWRCDLNERGGNLHWKQFTVKDGLGDNDAYALASDKQGRVWVGHLNHGVSVWNGAAWKNYDVMDGPLGSRVFDIEVCPTDGDVWIATDAGLARYSVGKDSWTYFSRADGMPSDQINGIAFDPSGNIYCATQADGLTYAQASKDYAEWDSVKANTFMPDRASGEGLPSNVTNDVLVARGNRDGVGAGVIYVSTIYGLAWSGDGAKTWKFVRGADWQKNIAGRTKRVAPVGGDVDEDELLMEDWTTCLEEDSAGTVWVGHRFKGFEGRDPDSQRVTFASDGTTLASDKEDYVRAILAAPGVPLLVARYGGNGSVLASVGNSTAKTDLGLEVPVQQRTAPFPSPASAPDVEMLKAMQARLANLSTPLQPGEGVFLGDDWRTWGDWVGRYGRGHATLCALDGRANETFRRYGRTANHVLNNIDGYAVGAHSGPHVQLPMTPWINWLKTDVPRSVYSPILGYRRQAEWSDYGNILDYHPWSHEGPDIWVNVTVPAGMHRASLYFFNKDGQADQNRFRDYPIELKRTLPDLQEMDEAPALARTRVSDFWGGVYKQFALCGPAKFSFKVGRNHSYAVIMQAVLLDPMTTSLESDEASKPLTWMEDATYGAPAIVDGKDAPRNPEALTAARDLWKQLDDAAWKKGGLGLQWPMRLQALRVAVAAGAPPSLIANWRWKLNLWNQTERSEWQETMRMAFPPKD
jgi:hypothetical protein